MADIPSGLPNEPPAKRQRLSGDGRGDSGVLEGAPIAQLSLPVWLLLGAVGHPLALQAP